MSRITILRLKTSQDNKADTHRCVLKWFWTGTEDLPAQ